MKKFFFLYFPLYLFNKNIRRKLNELFILTLTSSLQRIEKELRLISH